MSADQVVPNVSLGAKSGDGLSPLNRPGAAQRAAFRGGVEPFDPREDGNTVEVVDAYLRSLEGPAASSERLRVLHLESQQETPRVSIRGMVEYLDDGSDVYDVPAEEPEEGGEQGDADGSVAGDEAAGQGGEQDEEGQTSVDGSTVTEA